MDKLSVDQLLKLATLAVTVAVDNEGTSLEKKAMETADRLLEEVVRRNEEKKSTERVQSVEGAAVRITFRKKVRP